MKKEAGTFTSQYGCRTAAVSYEKGRRTVTVVFTYKTGWNKLFFSESGYGGRSKERYGR